MRTCKATYKQGRSILYGANSFLFTQQYGLAVLSSFLGCIGSQNAALIKHVAAHVPETRHCPEGHQERLMVELKLVGRIESPVARFPINPDIDDWTRDIFERLTGLRNFDFVIPPLNVEWLLAPSSNRDYEGDHAPEGWNHAPEDQESFPPIGQLTEKFSSVSFRTVAMREFDRFKFWDGIGPRARRLEPLTREMHLYMSKWRKQFHGDMFMAISDFPVTLDARLLGLMTIFPVPRGCSDYQDTRRLTWAFPLADYADETDYGVDMDRAFEDVLRGVLKPRPT